MAYDPVRQETVLFGGETNTSQILGDTRTWDGTAWILKTTPVAPPPRYLASMAFDKMRQKIVLFGGTDRVTYFTDTWEWDGISWTRRTLPLSPGPATGKRMAYDSVRNCILLVTDTMEAWDFDGTQWTQRSTQTQPPRAMWLSFDERRGRAVMFYSTTGFAIELDGNGWISGTSRTSFLNPAGSAEYCPWLGVTVLAHADTGAMTLGYDGQSFFRFLPYNDPQVRQGSAMVADTGRRRLVDTGGVEGQIMSSLHVFEFDHQFPAATQRFGSGCPGSHGLPVHDIAGLPYMQSFMQLRLTNGPVGNTIAALALGASDQSWGTSTLPLSLATYGMPGCSLLTSLDLTIPVSLSSGSGLLDVYVGGSPSNLIGRTLYSQWFLMDPSANYLGVVASNGMRSTVGSF